jgi:hypothetical protein
MTICLYPSTLICLYQSYLLYLLLVPTGSERACKTIFHTPDVHIIRVCFSLALRHILEA